MAFYLTQNNITFDIEYLPSFENIEKYNFSISYIQNQDKIYLLGGKDVLTDNIDDSV